MLERSEEGGGSAETMIKMQINELGIQLIVS
jgi:hypothetical protein